MTLALTMGLFLNLPFGEVGGASAQIAVTALPKTVAGGYNISCNNGSDGEVTTVVTGNTGPYTFSWGTSNGVYPGNSGLSLTGATASSINSLVVGTYWVTVTDSLNNTATDTVTLIQPSVLGVSIDAHTFAGGTHISEHGAADGEMYSDVTGGIPPYSYLWAPGSHTNMNYKEVAAGDYTLVVTDAGGCTAEVQQTLTEPTTGLSVTVTPTTLEGGMHLSGCDEPDGSAVAHAQGGIAPYRYYWGTTSEYNSGAIQNGGSTMVEGDSIVSRLGAGTNRIMIVDANGAKLTDEFELTAPEPMQVEVTPSDLLPNGYHVSCHDCSNATLTATVTGGTGPFTYQWWKEQENGTATLQNAGEPVYELVVTDANGCRVLEKAGLKIPERDDWSVNGNSGLDINGDLKWLGTTDSTDLMMKANGQPMLRLGADGNVDVLGQLRIPAHAATNAQVPLQIGLNPDGTLMVGQPFPPMPAPAQPCENAQSIAPQWNPEPNLLYTCVNVGIGIDEADHKLVVSGSAHVSDELFTGYGLRVGTMQGLQGAKADIRGGTIIGYINGYGPSIVNAQLDVRADGDPARFTFETRDNAGRSSFRVRNNGKVVVGDGTFNDANDGTATLFFGNEDYNIRAVDGEGLIIANAPNWEAIRIPEGTNDVLMPARVSIGAERVVAGPHTNYKLSVDGKIVGKEIFVSNDDNYWADFVFKEGYRLRSLEEVRHYIDSAGHLPDVPSAASIAKNGQNLGRMDAILLMKIEELTLHLIELNKDKEDLERMNARLVLLLDEFRHRILELENRVCYEK